MQDRHEVTHRVAVVVVVVLPANRLLDRLRRPFWELAGEPLNHRLHGGPLSSGAVPPCLVIGSRSD
jgi:hypothetical protein